MVKDFFNYKGKVCVVTGGTSGMGAAGVNILREMGADIYLLDIKPPSDSTLKYIPVDLGKKESIDEAVAKLPRKIDKIFNFAGVAGTQYSGRTFTPAEVVTINFIGPRYLIESLIPRMNEGGAIAIVSSVGGEDWQKRLELHKDFDSTPGFNEAVEWLNNHKEAYAGPICYLFSKEAIIFYVKRRSWELCEKKLRINTVAPGPTQTPMMKDFHALFSQEIIDQALSPIKRYATPEEQAQAMVFLNSDAASYISGVDLIVDYGYWAGVQSGKKT